MTNENNGKNNIDEKVIDFKTLKDQAKDSDVDKFENYMYDLYDKMIRGDGTMFDLHKKVNEYMAENDISEEKFMNIQRRMIERFGFNPDDLSEDFEKFKKDFDKNGSILSGENEIQSPNSQSVGAKLGFYKLYDDGLKEKKILEYNLKNDKNDIRFILDKDKITLISEKKIDFSDNEMNILMAYYKETVGGNLRVIVCEATNSYDYL